MVKIGLIVPVYKNFEGFAELMASVDQAVVPIVIPNWKYNLGVSAGWNAGINKSIEKRCDLALICNDDIILDPGTVHKLNHGVRNENYDLVTGVNSRNALPTEHPEYVYAPDFSCFMIAPEEFLNKFGHFDEGFTPAYFEDNDMAYRIKLAGGTAWARTDAGMYHKGSVTQNWGGAQVVSGSMFESNRSYYVEKWGGLPGQETFTRPWNDKNLEISDW